MERQDVAEAAVVNFIVHASWALERLPEMRVSTEFGVTLTDCGLPCDTFNIAGRSRLAPEDAERRIQSALAFFRESDLPFSWWVSPGDRPDDLGDLLERAGLIPAETELAMYADLTQMPPASRLPDGLAIRRARTESDLRDFASVVAANWTPPDPHVLRFYARAASAFLRPDSPQRFYVGNLDGLPVASSELVWSGGEVVGLYNVCTLEAYRRRGIGAALTHQPLLDAFAEGAMMGVLQAAEAGVSIYARLGLQPFGAITEYKPPL